MARRRRHEAEASAAVLGVDRLEWLGLRSGEWTVEQMLPAVEAVMADHRPVLVYAPSQIDFHPEHRAVAEVLARLWTSASVRPAAVRVYPVQVPLTPALANVVVDVTPVIDRVRAALDAYATQLANMPRALRQRRYAARWCRSGEYAEEFWQLGAEMYARLHHPSRSHGGARFRGIRAHPVSDPLAYLVGVRARQRLARVARGSG